jgi:hypothetical protein
MPTVKRPFRWSGVSREEFLETATSWSRDSKVEMARYWAVRGRYRQSAIRVLRAFEGNCRGGRLPTEAGCYFSRENVASSIPSWRTIR